MQIKVLSDNAAYITIGDWTIYVDNSTKEHIISSWKDGYRDVINVASNQGTFTGFKLDVDQKGT